MKALSKPTLGLIVLAAAALAVAAACWRWPGAEEPPRTITLYGNVELRAAELAFDEQERVAEILVEEGEAVAAGQVLARLERDRLEAQLAQAEAEIVAARARLANAKRHLQRLEVTTRAGGSTEQALDDARTEADTARATLAAQEARTALLRIRLADTELHAPADGVIQSRVIEAGEMASPSRVAFVLARTDRKWVRAYLPEPQLGHVERGMPAQVISDSFPDRPFEGHVGFISPQAEFTPKAVQTTELRTMLVYEVRILVDDPDNRLRLGMPVTVHIDTTGDTPAGAER